MSDGRHVPLYAIDRPGLRARLDAGSTAPLLLVVAPAGSGKTVLLGQWADSRPRDAVAWIDVESSDVDALVFVRRLIDAVADIDERLADLHVPVGTPEGGLGDAFIEAFADELRNLSDLVVVFDDLHQIAGSAIVADLWRLVDMLPPNAHFVFASRVDLQLGWSRHRLAHGLVELRQAELAFSQDVTGRVLERITGAPVSDATAAAVTRHTEGWAAGVQLSALSMRFQSDPERIVERLIENDRLIVDYLTEEILAALTPERMEALLRLSVLDEICGGLAETVAGVTKGDELLRQLERESMFIVGVPDHSGWYRFHHLFRDLLRFRLREVDGQGETRLLKAAAAWHLNRGNNSAAVEYLVRARGWDGVCEIALASGSEVYERCPTTVAGWLARVPEDVRWSTPHVELLYGIVAGMNGQSAHAVDILTRLLAAEVLDIGSQQVALTYLATCVYFQPHPDRFLDIAERSLALLDEHPAAATPDLLHLTSHALLETLSRVALARAHLLLGDIPAARSAAHAALSSEGSNYGPYRVQALGTLAFTEAWTGRLKRATDLADDALELARELSLLSHPAPADAYLARAIVAIQRGESEAGVFSLQEGNLRAAANHQTELMWLAHLASALIDPRDTGSAAMEPHGHPPPVATRVLLAVEWRRARLSGAPRDPGRWGESEWSTLAFEQVASLLERGCTVDARVLLERVRYVPDPAFPAAMVEHELASAWLAAAEGRRPDSKQHLSLALDLAEREGLAYPVLAAGAGVLALVEALPRSESPFRQRLSQSSGSLAEALNQLPNPLTAREMELLELLPTRSTSAEIAARWYVSVNTVKTHLGHVYRKLDVADRTAAIARAHELGLLEEHTIARRR